MDLRADLAFMLADAPGSVTVTCGAESGAGILTEATKPADASLGNQKLVGVERVLVFDPITLPSIQKGANLQAGGRAFKVLLPIQAREDGTALAHLGKA